MHIYRYACFPAPYQESFIDKCLSPARITDLWVHSVDVLNVDKWYVIVTFTLATQLTCGGARDATKSSRAGAAKYAEDHTAPYTMKDQQLQRSVLESRSQASS